jgi:hypothetical protein
MNRKRWILIAIAAVGCVGAYVLVNQLTPDPTQDEPTVSLQEDWDRTIRRYGIEPIFPPEEDLTAGDILAVVVADNDDDPTLTAKDKSVDKAPFLRRSVKLTHLDIRKALEEEYGLLPVFPTPPSPPEGTQQKADPNASVPARIVARQFSGEILQSNLPLAAFPSLKIEGVNTAGVGLSAGSRADAKYLKSTRGVDQLQLKEMRTYGLSAVRALELLMKHCAQAENNCSEATARKHLERVVGDRINARYTDPNDKAGNSKYAMTVEIVMVNRVYLSRSIVHLRRSATLRGGEILGQRDDTKKDTPPEQPASTPQSANERAEYDAMKKQVAQLQKQLADARGGGSIVYESSSGNEISLEEKFDRPVAIGYRAVRYDFPAPATEPVAAPQLAPAPLPAPAPQK